MKFNTQHYDCARCKLNTTKLLFVKQGFSIVQCKNCNFVYVNPRIADEQLADIYKHNYFSNNDYGYNGYEQEKRLRVKNFQKWLNAVKRFIPTNNNIRTLDIGCAAGYCLDVMKINGWQAEGIELDEAMCVSLNNRGFKVSSSGLNNFKNQDKYNVITLFDVLEHLPDVDGVFQRIYNLTADEGIVVVVTPNHGSIQRKLMGKKWFQYKPVEHIQYFTLDSMTAFAERNQFKIIYNSGCGQFADTDFLINRLQYYNFSFPAYLLAKCLKILHLNNRFFYINTGSLFVVLKKS